MPSHPASCRRGFARHLPAEQHRTNPVDKWKKCVGQLRTVADRRSDDLVDFAAALRDLVSLAFGVTEAGVVERPGGAWRCDVVRTVSIHPGGPARAAQDRRDAEVSRASQKAAA